MREAGTRRLRRVAAAARAAAGEAAGCGASTASVLPLLHPESQALFVWQCIVNVAVSWVAIVAPLQAAFDEQFEQELLWALANLVVDLIFLADIFVSFRTGFYHDGVLVMDPERVARKYLRGRFALDVIVCTPYVWFVSGDTFDGDFDYHSGSATLVRIVRLVRLLRVVPRLLRNDARRVKRTTSLFLDVLRFNPSVARVCQLLLLVLLAAHWVGCLWWLVGTLECNVYADPDAACDNGWMPTAELQRMPFGVKYCHAFLWGTSITTGFVPFDVEPVTLAEVIYTTFAIFFGLFVSIITISAATTAMHNMDAKMLHTHQRLEHINRYLVFRKVPKELAQQILEFLSFSMTSSHDSIREMHELKELPTELSVRLTLVLFHDLISQCAFFHPLSSATVVALVQDLRPVVMCPRQLAMVEGTKVHALHFIRRGVVRVWVKYNEPAHLRQLLATLGDNDFFGEGALTDVTGDGNADADAIATVTCQCISFCDMLTLSREQCQEVLRREAVARRWRSVQCAFSTRTRPPTTHGERCSTAAADADADADAEALPMTPPGAVTEERSALESLSRLRRNSRRAIVGPAGGVRKSGSGECSGATPKRHAADMERAIQMVVRSNASGRRKGKHHDGYTRFGNEQ